jgi:hypothetical protein
MSDAPILILAYNRPDKVTNLIESIRPFAPKTVVVGIDGPRAHVQDDAEKVALVHKVAESINWTNDVHVLGRKVNLGLKRAVIDSVDWTIARYGKAIIVEEDVIVGPQFIDFMNLMLEVYKSDERVGHISGYNVVPEKFVGSNGVRLTRYPESIAWATWARSWENFDESVEWGTTCRLSELRNVTGTYSGALKWRLNFADAKSNRVSTWAYRWINTLWSRRQFAISPNVNLVSYNGYDNGSHTFLKPAWSELKIGNFNFNNLDLPGGLPFDEKDDYWVKKKVFGESLYGVTKQLLISGYNLVQPERH